MAANFWTSSHYKQLLDPEEVDVVHAVDKEKGLTQEEFKLIKIHMTNRITIITSISHFLISRVSFSDNLFAIFVLALMIILDSFCILTVFMIALFQIFGGWLNRLK